MPNFLGKGSVFQGRAQKNGHVFIYLQKRYQMKPKEILESDQEIMVEIGAKIRKLRKDKNLTYIKMAEKCGINRNTYNSMENGKVYFTISKLLAILRYHNISLSEFFKDL